MTPRQPNSRMHLELPTSIQGMIDVIHRDFPGHEWLLSNCECGDHCVAVIRPPSLSAVEINIATGQVRRLQLGPEAWEAKSHEPTAYAALVAAYGQALEKSNG